jgi:hypothetical protein
MFRLLASSLLGMAEVVSRQPVSGPARAESVVDNIALRQVFLQIVWLSVVSVITLVLLILSFIFLRSHIIYQIDSVLE